jgi:glucokinase
MSEKLTAAVVEDHKVTGQLRTFPEIEDDYALIEMPTEDVATTLCDEVIGVIADQSGVTGVGVGMPGLIRNGVVEESPNLPQLKGARICDLVTTRLRDRGLDVPVTISNDADAFASGIAAVHGKLDTVVRVWTLGVGIGYGRYPYSEGVWEGGHTVVTLDEKENYCGCGGRGHLEGIMGHRSMRLRFLDMEPDEVFAAAKQGDPRCLDFKRLWHRALAAATSTSIHLRGPGRFYLAGFNVKFIDMPMLKDYMQQMVKMSPLQSYAFEIIEDDLETRLIGAAVCAEQALGR